jgi:hypothetical protein
MTSAAARGDKTRIRLTEQRTEEPQNTEPQNFERLCRCAPSFWLKSIELHTSTLVRLRMIRHSIPPATPKVSAAYDAPASKKVYKKFFRSSFIDLLFTHLIAAASLGGSHPDFLIFYGRLPVLLYQYTASPPETFPNRHGTNQDSAQVPVFEGTGKMRLPDMAG